MRKSGKVNKVAAKKICVDPEERTTRISAMKMAGKAVSYAGKVSFEHGDLKLDGVTELDKRYNDVHKLIAGFGELIVKDAGLLKTISDAFQQTDESVNKKSGSKASSASSGKKSGNQSGGKKSTGTSSGKKK